LGRYNRQKSQRIKPEIIELPGQAWNKMWNVLETDDLSGLISLLDDYPYLVNQHLYSGQTQPPIPFRLNHFVLYKK